MNLFQLITQKFNSVWKAKKRLAFLLGMLSVEMLPPFDLFWIGFFTFPALLLLINSAATKKSAFAIGYWFGFGYFACNMAWIGNALLLDAAHLGWLFPITLGAAGAFFGLFIAFPAMLSVCFKNLYSRYLSFAAWWVVFEWLRSFIFTGFPWNLLGSSLAFSDILLQAAAVIGTYGLSLLVLMIVTAPALYIFYRTRVSLAMTAAIIISISAATYFYGYQRLSQADKTPGEIRVRIVQPAIPQAMKWNKEKLESNFAEYIKLSQAPGLNQIDFVIWGETATPFPLDFEPQYLTQITQAIPEKGYLLTGLVSYRISEGDFRPLNSMFAINHQGQILASYNKSHLVPFGEYIPFRKFMPNWLRPVTNTIADFLPGNGPSVIKLENQPSFGALICYEVIFPHQIINPDNRPDWLVNLTNDGWYGHSQGPYQHFVTTRLRAIEEGRTLIRAANTGISAVISPYGQILASLDLDKKGFIDANLPKHLYLSTAYGHFGNLIPLILCFINMILAFLIRLPFQ